MFSFQSSKYPPHDIHDYKRHLYTYRQDRKTWIPDYNKSFRNKIEIVEHNGGTFGIEKGVVTLALDGLNPPIDMADTTQEDITDTQAVAKEVYLACAFLLGSDKNRFGNFLKYLENSYTWGEDR